MTISTPSPNPILDYGDDDIEAPRFDMDDVGETRAARPSLLRRLRTPAIIGGVVVLGGVAAVLLRNTPAGRAVRLGLIAAGPRVRGMAVQGARSAARRLPKLQSKVERGARSATGRLPKLQAKAEKSVRRLARAADQRLQDLSRRKRPRLAARPMRLLGT